MASLVTGCILLLGLASVSSKFPPKFNGFHFPNIGQHHQQNQQEQHQQSGDATSKCFHPNRCNFRNKYRSIDGSCNNVEITTWGQVDTRFVRILSSRYSDGVDKISDLPNPRNLHLALFPTTDNPSQKYSLAVMQWGQLMAHDTALSSSQSNGNCCVNGKAQASSSCAAISVSNDTFYGQFDQTCLSVVRTINTKSEGCNITPVLQLSGATHFIDLSPVYGSREDVAKQLRTFQKGLLRTQVVDGHHYCPSASNDGCDPRSKVCYLAGDPRVNQNLGFTSLQILLLREHNRVASELFNLNPHWSDEILYQETRRIVIAQVQQITYGEWLPLILGRSWESLGEKYVKYDVQVDPSTIDVFTAGCFRYFHTLVQENLQFIDEDGNIKSEVPMREWFNRPDLLQDDFDGMLLGLTKQPAQTADPNFVEDLGNFLFKGTNSFGSDLVARDITRGRDHGLPSYNKIREFCGSPPAKAFSEFEDLIEKERVKKLEKEYINVDDVDLYVGTTFEKKLESSLLGATCQCVVIEQFRRWKVGDRYFFDHPNEVGSFTEQQRQELKKASLARLICDNGNSISRIHYNAFLQVSHNNRVQKCEDLPRVSLSHWKSVK